VFRWPRRKQLLVAVGADDCRVLDLVVTEAALSHVGMPFRSTSLPCGVQTPLLRWRIRACNHCPIPHSPAMQSNGRADGRRAGLRLGKTGAQTAQQGLCHIDPLDAVKSAPLTWPRCYGWRSICSCGSPAGAVRRRGGFESAWRPMRDSSRWPRVATTNEDSTKGEIFDVCSFQVRRNRGAHHGQATCETGIDRHIFIKPYGGGTKRGTRNAAIGRW
jgi:hypothetical protein